MNADLILVVLYSVGTLSTPVSKQVRTVQERCCSLTSGHRYFRLLLAITSQRCFESHSCQLAYKQCRYLTFEMICVWQLEKFPPGFASGFAFQPAKSLDYNFGIWCSHAWFRRTAREIESRVIKYQLSCIIGHLTFRTTATVSTRKACITKLGQCIYLPVEAGLELVTLISS